MTRKIAIFAHSTNPRGGVVHALYLAEALCDAGYDATLLAPALPGATLFRTPRCRFIPIPARPVASVAEMVATRIDEITTFLRAATAPRFDTYHAQDPISGNALADLVRDGFIDAFIRTVHHLDIFTDPRLTAWQDRAVREASQLCCVSRLWQTRLLQHYGRRALVVGNGVDLEHFSSNIGDVGSLRARLGLPAGRVLLSIGGVERRKNTLNILRAFQSLHADMPDLHLLIAGGASLLDHHAQRTAFNAALADTAFSDRVHLVGVIADQDMPALYRLADALVFPSLEEGFGLCALESLASLRPTIVSARAPFTEHFLPEEVLFTDPESPAAIAASMRLALAPEYAHYVRQNGRNVAGRFRWDKVALAHLPLYQSCATQELLHA